MTTTTFHDQFRNTVNALQINLLLDVDVLAVERYQRHIQLRVPGRTATALTALVTFFLIAIWYGDIPALQSVLGGAYAILKQAVFEQLHVRGLV